jgi:hypothetical protein
VATETPRHGIASSSDARLAMKEALDRPDKDLDHPRQLGRLAGGDRAGSGRIGDRRHRADEIGGAAHQRQSQLHRPPAARRNDAVEAQPQRHPVARERELHRPAGSAPRPRRRAAARRSASPCCAPRPAAPSDCPTAPSGTVPRDCRTDPSETAPARPGPPVSAMNLQARTPPSRSPRPLASAALT